MLQILTQTQTADLTRFRCIVYFLLYMLYVYCGRYYFSSSVNEVKQLRKL